MAQPIQNNEPSDPLKSQQDGAARVWMSQRQWMAVLENTERRAREVREDDQASGVDLRQSPRLPLPEDARCMIRMDENSDDHGTYLVKLRDISATGLGFNSIQRFNARTRCTVAIQDPQGHGLVCAARIVWCKSVDDEHHDVGIQFDQPIDPTRFSDDTLNVPC